MSSRMKVIMKIKSKPGEFIKICVCVCVYIQYIYIEDK